jgi:hypothetical protein
LHFVPSFFQTESAVTGIVERAFNAYIGAMLHRIAFAAVFAVVAAFPVHAQEDSEGQGLMERGVELFFEGLRQEMAPAMDDLRGLAEQFGPSMQSFFEEMGPAFADILGEVKDWSLYHAPEILTNGDIIMRRKVDPDEDAKPEPSGPTDI